MHIKRKRSQSCGMFLKLKRVVVGKDIMGKGNEVIISKTYEMVDYSFPGEEKQREATIILSKMKIDFK